MNRRHGVGHDVKIEEMVHIVCISRIVTAVKFFGHFQTCVACIRGILVTESRRGSTASL